MCFGKKRIWFLFFYFQGKITPGRMKRMKQKTSLWSGVSVLIVVVLAITAFVRGGLQIWLFAGAFAVWSVWASVKFLIPCLKAYKYRWAIKKQRKKKKAQLPKKEFDVPDFSDPVGVVLLRHVNFRISAYSRPIPMRPGNGWRNFPRKSLPKAGQEEFSFMACRTLIMPTSASIRKQISDARC